MSDTPIHDGMDWPYKGEWAPPSGLSANGETMHSWNADSAPEDLPTFEDGTRPVVPERVRTVAYWATLGTAALGLLVPGLVDVWVPGISEPVAATVDVVSGVVALVGGGLGVIYRPTR